MRDRPAVGFALRRTDVEIAGAGFCEEARPKDTVFRDVAGPFLNSPTGALSFTRLETRYVESCPVVQLGCRPAGMTGTYVRWSHRLESFSIPSVDSI